MKVWLRQKHNKHFDSFRYGEASLDGQRVIVLCPETDNLLLDCSRAFFGRELAKGRIVIGNSPEASHAQEETEDGDHRPYWDR